MNEMHLEAYKAPKILGDVFESLVGAIFVDGGILEVNRVLKELMAPLLLFVAKYSKQMYYEPKEQFLIKAKKHKINPKFRHSPVKEDVKLSEVLSRTLADDLTVPMVKVEVHYNNGQILTSAHGNNNFQAERNASIRGYRILL